MCKILERHTDSDGPMLTQSKAASYMPVEKDPGSIPSISSAKVLQLKAMRKAGARFAANWNR